MIICTVVANNYVFILSLIKIIALSITSVFLHFYSQSSALNETDKAIFFNACEWGVKDPWDWMAQYANSWRSGPDHHDDWKSTASIIEINADKGKFAGIVI